MRNQSNTRNPLGSPKVRKAFKPTPPPVPYTRDTFLGDLAKVARKPAPPKK